MEWNHKSKHRRNGTMGVGIDGMEPWKYKQVEWNHGSKNRWNGTMEVRTDGMEP